MAINKNNVFFSAYQRFNEKKLSANKDNTAYTVGISGDVQIGSPDILWDTVVYIKDTKQIWTHHSFYGEKESNGVNIKGFFNSYDELLQSHPTGNSGDSYMINKELYCWNGELWQNVGLIKGSDGYTPIKNIDYFDGKSAYELWKDLGNSGNIDSFFESLKGPKGDSYVLTLSDKLYIAELVYSMINGGEIKPETYTVSLNENSINCTVTIDGFGILTSNTPISVNKGTQVTLKVSPNTGYKIDKVLVNNVLVTLTNNSYNLIVNSNTTISIQTSKIQVTITTGYYGTSTSSYGTIMINNQNVTSLTVDYGTLVTFKATSNSGYEFEGWYLSSTKKSSSLTYTITATTNVTIKANFTLTVVSSDPIYYGVVYRKPEGSASGVDVLNDYTSILRSDYDVIDTTELAPGTLTLKGNCKTAYVAIPVNSSLKVTAATDIMDYNVIEYWRTPHLSVDGNYNIYYQSSSSVSYVEYTITIS